MIRLAFDARAVLPIEARLAHARCLAVEVGIFIGWTRVALCRVYDVAEAGRKGMDRRGTSKSRDGRKGRVSRRGGADDDEPDDAEPPACCRPAGSAPA